MTTLPLGEVKTHLSELVGRVHDHHERVTVTVHGRPSAVLVAVEDLEQHDAEPIASSTGSTARPTWSPSSTSATAVTSIGPESALTSTYITGSAALPN
jgi:prevent-host-death family protein